MVVDILDAPVGGIETGHAVGFFKDGWHEMVQTSGTAHEEYIVSGLSVSITNLIFIGGIRLTIQLFQYQSCCSVDDEEQTGDDEYMYENLLHVRTGNR